MNLLRQPSLCHERINWQLAVGGRSLRFIQLSAGHFRIGPLGVQAKTKTRLETGQYLEELGLGSRQQQLFCHGKKF